ncbi:hypothetical protein N665_0530s0010 [Sinapis alba]|nr:hypothetical protein N665_0530s0010 [Sinapis alba]
MFREALALHITYKEPWFKETICFWLGPGDQIWPDQKIKLKMKGMYMFDDFSRIGSVILALHEISDVFLDLWILWSTSYQSINVKLEWDKKHPMETGLPSTVYYVFNTLLWCLQILHFYWWVLISRVLISQIRSKGKIDRDVRSDSEGEDDEHQD